MEEKLIDNKQYWLVGDTLKRNKRNKAKNCKINKKNSKAPKKVKLALRNEVSNVVNDYISYLIENNIIKLGFNGMILDLYGHEIKFKNIVVRKGEVVTGLRVSEIAIKEIIKNNYTIK